ncbi:MAG: sn-glycerol-3-phosphate ABC transporter ATP-binding protein UgpC [bacterium]
MPGVSFEHVTKRFGDVTIVEEFDLEVADGELLVLVGGSGSGKSTILRMVAGLESVSSGIIRIGERDITPLAPRDRDVAMVFQDYALYPHLTVRENLSLGLRLRRVAKPDVARRVAWASEMLGIAALLERRPKELSGGQRQRVAMGRAMVREPLAFLFDEPLSNLDAGLRAQMRIEIGSLQRRLRTTTIYVTHDQVEAMTLGDRIVVLSEGRIQQVGAPIDLYRAPANRFVAGFIGSPPMNFIGGRLEGDGDGGRFVADGVSLGLPRALAAATPATSPVALGIRPEDLRLEAPTDAGGDAAGGRLAGRVVLVERLGGSSHVHVDVGTHRLLVAVTDERVPSVGQTVDLMVPAPKIHLFAADGRVVSAD